MSEESTKWLRDEINDLLVKAGERGDLSNPEVLGVLEMIKMDIYVEVTGIGDDN